MKPLTRLNCFWNTSMLNTCQTVWGPGEHILKEIEYNFIQWQKMCSACKKNYSNYASASHACMNSHMAR